MAKKRIIWIILDSVGMGELPDAKDFDDVGTHTIGHVAQKNGGINIPNMIKLGIGNIPGMIHLDSIENASGCYGKGAEISKGKDTTVGHWEMAGIYSKEKFPTYPEGFPVDIIKDFCEKTGVQGVLGNEVASGTEIIARLGDEHVKTKKPIIYTSADSVFQIACHEEVFAPEELYRLCEVARNILKDEHGVARVIARPFVGENGNYTRTSNRRDFSIKPSENNLLSYLKKANYDVIAVGKIEDIFAGVGVTEAVHTKDNQDGIDKTIEYIKNEFEGLLFTNLVEFDSKWGHRNDYLGYAKGLEEFDARIPDIINAMQEDDILIINSDHGCDPTTKGTDHTREYIPILIYGKNLKSDVYLGERETFADIGATIAEYFNIDKLEIGTSFLGQIK